MVVLMGLASTCHRQGHWQWQVRRRVQVRKARGALSGTAGPVRIFVDHGAATDLARV